MRECDHGTVADLIEQGVIHGVGNSHLASLLKTVTSPRATGRDSKNGWTYCRELCQIAALGKSVRPGAAPCQGRMSIEKRLFTLPLIKAAQDENLPRAIKHLNVG
jgi:hypothetical protein